MSSPTLLIAQTWTNEVGARRLVINTGWLSYF
jgi:hypothetical protein